MWSPLRTPFGAVFQTEVLLNSKRVAPYAMAVVFAANALLWWGWGPAGPQGWATNGDFFIARSFAGFSFMTLPLFNAVIMGDPVARDFRTGVAPLIFSKPLGRAAYLSGKFFGNFFVLVCCQAAFALTLALLQAFHKQGMVVQEARLLPYLKHLLVVVVVTHAVLAAFYFTVGTLTRNARIVYALAASFYPLYIAYQAVLKGLPPHWRIALDPLLMNWADSPGKARGGGWLDAEAVNRIAHSYGPEVLANRALMLLAAAGCLAILYARFSTTERFQRPAGDGRLTTIGLGAGDQRLFRGEADFGPEGRALEVAVAAPPKAVALPEVVTHTEGARAGLRQLAAAVGVELRLLFAERSLVVLLPLATFVSALGPAYFEVVPDPSYSAAYAARTAEPFLLFLAAIAVFYTGEAMHRDRELRIEPVLWSVPAPNYVLLLSKFLTTLLLSLSAALLVGAAAVAVQICKGHTPVEPTAYAATYGLILLPGAAFMIAAATALNVALRDKYLAYAACLALGGGLFYLYNLGFNHPLYNPLLYGLWTPADLTGASKRLPQILTHRAYCLALAGLCLALAHLCFERGTAKGGPAGGRLSGRALAVLAAAAAAALAGSLVKAGW